MNLPDKPSLPAPEESAPRPTRWKRDLGLGLAVAAVLGILVYLLIRPEKLPEGISASEYQRAERTFEKLYNKRPERRDVFFYLGDLSVQKENWTTALACFAQIPPDDPEYGHLARVLEGQILLDLHRAADAEASLREFFEFADREPAPSRSMLRSAYERLAYLLSVELRFEERKPILAEMHALDLAKINESKLYYFPHLLIWRSERGRQRLDQFLAEDPDNLLLLIAKGRYLIAEGELDEAGALLKMLHSRDPGNVEIIAALAECFFEAGDESAMAACLASLPETAGEDCWLLLRMRGELALAEERWNDAVRHFRKMLSYDPASPESHMGLARAYEALGKTAERDEVLKRSEILAKIRVFMSNVYEGNPAACGELAGMCEEIGLGEAARTFRRHAENISQAPSGPAKPALNLEGSE